jgi:hypothetical protein
MKIIEKIKNNKVDKNKEINKILNIKKNYNISFKKDSLYEGENTIVITDEDNNKVLTSEYIFFGIYQSSTKLWVWSSSIPGVSKNQIELVNNIRNKSFIFENDSNKDILFYNQLLTNDVLNLNDSEDSLGKIDDVLLYLSDSIVILKPLNSLGNLQYIGLTKIKTKYV